MLVSPWTARPVANCLLLALVHARSGIEPLANFEENWRNAIAP
jgi:hypothetical protein